MDTRWPFLDESGRLRSGWRFLIFFIAFLFAAAVIGGGVMAILASLLIEFEPGTPSSFLVSGTLLLIPALLVGWLAGKVLEGLPFRALGAWFTAGWMRHLALGILLGAATLAMAVLIAFVFGGLRFQVGTADAGTLARSLAVSLLIFAIGAAGEEVLFRGYILQTFSRSAIAWVGIAMTSLFFAVVHLKNPSANLISTIDTVMAGVWLGIAYLKTRDLWFVWGLHLMWNWMQGSFFGIEVSGLTDFVSASVLKELDLGPAWLTGGSYGLEGGIASTIALVVSTIAIYFMPYLKPGAEMMRLTSPPS
jgi:hypothetical protein